jgi:hypothetical protein
LPPESLARGFAVRMVGDVFVEDIDKMAVQGLSEQLADDVAQYRLVCLQVRIQLNMSSDNGLVMLLVQLCSVLPNHWS